MGIFTLWTYSGLVASLKLGGVLCGFIGVCAVYFALVKWRSELYSLNLSKGIGIAIKQLSEGPDGQRIERLVLGLLRARRVYLDTKFLASAWSFAITGLTFGVLIFMAAMYNVVLSLLIRHESQLSLMSEFQCTTMLLATGALIVAACFEIFNIQQGMVYPRTLNKRWSKIKAIAGPNWTGDIEEALCEALVPIQAASR